MASRIWQTHPDEDVQAALRRLCDALCSWERATGRPSLFILRDGHDFKLRADCGIPIDSDQDDITDDQLLQGLQNRLAAQ